MAIASSLAESGLSHGAAAMILQAVYSTPTASDTHPGRGQGTRIRWFVDAIQVRYSHKLDKIRTDYRAFRSFISDMEEVTQMRDELNGNGYPVSFHGAFILWELGESVDSVQRLVDEHLSFLKQFKGSGMRRLIDAALLVQSGRFTELATALAFLNPNSDDES